MDVGYIYYACVWGGGGGNVRVWDCMWV
jgi:hypothetical protein